jgi:hypothetical protein
MVFYGLLDRKTPRAKSKETGIKVPRAAHHGVGKQEWNDDGVGENLVGFRFLPIAKARGTVEPIICAPRAGCMSQPLHLLLLGGMASDGAGMRCSNITLQVLLHEIISRHVVF